MKIWNYGDSHAAGHELGSADDRGAAWLKEMTGCDSRLGAIKKLGDRYATIVKSRWYRYLRDNNKTSTLIGYAPCSPELTYAGNIAAYYNAELVTRAEPGASNDFSVSRMIADCIDWEDDDIVMLGIVTPLRFMPNYDKTRHNHQWQWFDAEIQEVFSEYGPDRDAYNIWTQGLVHLAKSLHPNVVCLRTTMDDISINNVDTTIDLLDAKLSLTEFANKTYPHKDMRYPGGHFHESVHNAYAEYLLKECLKI